MHRLWFGDQRLDIIPFGGVERADRTITWPTKDAEVMRVAGLAEAMTVAVAIQLPGAITVDVAPLPAQVLLKVWAWMDRRYVAPGKDAYDIWMIVRSYASAGNQDRLYGDEGESALAALGFDLEAAGAWLLGKDAREVLANGPDQQDLLASADAILRPEIDPDGALRLVAQMPPGGRERQLSLLTAFHAGLFGTSLSKT